MKPRSPSERYWRANMRLIVVLLAVWGSVSYGCGVLWVEWLNQWNMGGVPLGFWFAQQGSIYVFVLLIVIYALVMDRLDKRFHRDSEHQDLR